MKKRKDKERREDQKRKQAETKQKLLVAKEHESEQKRLESDPFFSIYRPTLSEQESEDQFAFALAESASMASTTNEGPRTVWGTKQVASREEELSYESNDWADHIVINKSQRKRRGRK